MGRLLSKLKQAYHLLPTPPSTNYLPRPFEVKPYELLPPNAVIFDIGSKGAGGSYVFGNPPADATMVCVDIVFSAGVDLVADAHDLCMVKDNSVDCVVSISTLEHVYYPNKVIKEIYRILKPGGVVYINVPFIFPFHADPDDYYRFSYNGIKILCEEFECIDRGSNRGPASTMHHLLVHFCAMVFSFNNSTMYGLNVDLFSWILFWVKYMDKFLIRFQMAKVLNGDAYFIGRKPSPNRRA